MLGQYPMHEAESQRRQALARVYTLLIRLAEDKKIRQSTSG